MFVQLRHGLSCLVCEDQRFVTYRLDPLLLDGVEDRHSRVLAQLRVDGTKNCVWATLSPSASAGGREDLWSTEARNFSCTSVEGIALKNTALRLITWPVIYMAAWCVFCGGEFSLSFREAACPCV